MIGHSNSIYSYNEVHNDSKLTKKTNDQPILKAAKMNNANQNTEMKNYSITNINYYKFTFNNQTQLNSIRINSTANGQIGYFIINQSLIDSNFSISLHDYQQFNQSSLITYETVDPTINETYAEIQFKQSSYWNLEINLTYDFSADVNSTFYLSLTLYLPESGYNFNKPDSIYDYTTVNTPLNNSKIDYIVSYPYETIYFKLSVEPNRRVNFRFNENTPLILQDAPDNIRFWQFDPQASKPAILVDTPQDNNNGSYSFSWVSNTLYVSNILWIEIRLNPSVPITGNFSLSLSFQQEGYSLDSAINLQLNNTLIYNQLYSDRYSTQNVYFTFEIPYSDVNISFFAKSDNSLILANSKFRFYYERLENPLFDINEADSNTRGQVNTSFIPLKSGTYYIEYSPSGQYAPTGLWSIQVSYVKLPTFVWPFEFILFNVFYFLALPVIFIYINFKNRSEEITEWDLNQNNTDIFKTLSKNQRLNPKMEVPYQKILLKRRNIFIRDMIIDIVPVHIGEEEQPDQNVNIQSSLGFRYKNTLDNLLSLIVISWLILYWLINVLFYEMTKLSLLPYRTNSLSSINGLMYFLIFPIALILLIIYFYKESYLKSILNEVEYSISDTSLGSTVNSTKLKVLDNENLLKSLAYVRVLWNQAIKAFNEKNYSLFIIRADNSVKKLIETRFQQLIGTIDEKLEFNEIIEAVRNQGFDIPSTKKIEFFRKIRNKVVHSSHLLDEKTAIETFTYYSKFLGRLGLRT